MDTTSRRTAERRDAEDPLRRLRGQFFWPAGAKIQLDGNSLGLASHLVERSLARHFKLWAGRGVEAWDVWHGLAEKLAGRMSVLVGAEQQPESVILMDSTTVILHQMLVTLHAPLLRGPRGKRVRRRKILIDAGAFPTDRYAIQSYLLSQGLDPKTDLVEVSRDPKTRLLDEDAIIARMTDDIALVIMPGVVFDTGQLLEMDRVTDEARDREILIGWDLCHSVGAVPHHLIRWGCDFAFWCDYKYLNGGPGAVAGLFVNKRHHDKMPGMAGWWGSAKQSQFDMTHDLVPASGAGRFQIGTPHILSLASLEGALTLFERAGMMELRAKSLALTGYLIELIDARLDKFGATIVTPRENGSRGGHVAVALPVPRYTSDDVVRVSNCLRRRGVVGDRRQPDIIRLAPVPLYTRFVDCYDAVEIFEKILGSKAWRAGKLGSAVT